MNGGQDRTGQDRTVRLSMLVAHHERNLVKPSHERNVSV